MSPRVRCLRRVLLTVTSTGDLDLDAVRRATDHVRSGDDVVVVVRGRLGVDPAAADLLGRCLTDARTVSIEGTGGYIGQFANTVREACRREAAAS